MRGIGYVLKRYPRVSETFILQEILALERLGVPLHIFAIMDPHESVVHPDVSRVRAPIHYLRSESAVDSLKIAKSHARLFARSPVRYLSAMRHILVTRRRTPGGLGLALKHFWEAGRLADLAARKRIDHLHAHFATNPTSLARFAQLLTGIPFSFTAHAKDIYTSDPKRLSEKIEYSAFTATCTAYNLKHLTSLLRQYHPATKQKVYLVYHGVDSEKFCQEPRLLSDRGDGRAARDRMLILSVGRLVPKKGHPYLIRACAQLKRKGYAFECEVYGTGPLLSDLQALVADLNLDDRVSLKGSRTQDELAQIYRRADVFALVPFIQEDGDRDGLPNVLLEAMASGLPVVASKVSGIPELIVDEETGLLVNPQDEDALALALERLLLDRALRMRLARAGRDRVEYAFSAEGNVKQLAALLGFGGGESTVLPDQTRVAITLPELNSKAGIRQ